MAVHGDEVAEVARWAEGIDRVHECIAGRFRRPEPRRRSLDYLKGLLSPVERKNGWQLAEQGRGTPHPMGCSICCQPTSGTRTWFAMISGTTWWSTWATPTGCWWWMKPGFSRRGTSLWGCSVSTAARRDGGTDRELPDWGILDLRYCQGEDPAGPGALPAQVWADDQERREEAGVPEKVAFRTKPQLARRMLERAVESGVPFGWATGDEVYGNDRNLRLWLERRDIPHVLAIKSNEKLWAWTDKGPRQVRADRLASGVEESGWVRLSAGDGAKGPRVYDWALVDIRPLREPGKGCWLLARRSVAKPEETGLLRVLRPGGNNPGGTGAGGRDPVGH